MKNKIKKSTNTTPAPVKIAISAIFSIFFAVCIVGALIHLTSLISHGIDQKYPYSISLVGIIGGIFILLFGIFGAITAITSLTKHHIPKTFLFFTAAFGLATLFVREVQFLTHISENFLSTISIPIEQKMYLRELSFLTIFSTAGITALFAFILTTLHFFIKKSCKKSA